LANRHSAVFQAGGLIVVLVEVGRKAYLASIVPVIVNAILNEHQIVVDIVAFVNRGDFPRSRLGEKQRGKILASWVTRKMRTMAQFGIRDPDSAMSDITETIEPRSRLPSLRTGTMNGSVIASSLRNAEVAPQIIEQREIERQQLHLQNSFVPLPTGISEMPDRNYNESILGSPTGNGRASTKSDDTPTGPRNHQFELPSDGFDAEKNSFMDSVGDEFVVPGFSNTPEPPRVGPKPGTRDSLPAVDGRDGDLWSLPSQHRQGGGLRVHNADADSDDEDWQKDAIMHMNLAGR